MAVNAATPSVVKGCNEFPKLGYRSDRGIVVQIKRILIAFSIGLLAQSPQVLSQIEPLDYLMARVSSELGEPLQASTNIGFIGGQTRSISVALGSSDAFDEYGVRRYQVFDMLEFSLSTNAAENAVLRITSSTDMYEPSLRLVVEVNTAGQVLLFPIEVLIPALDQSGKERRLMLSRPADTLWRIANRTRDESVSNDQQMLALQRLNASSFQSSNINGLRPWSMLSLPDFLEASEISNAQARQEVAAQNQLWQQSSQPNSLGPRYDPSRDQVLGQVRITQPETSAKTPEQTGSLEREVPPEPRFAQPIEQPAAGSSPPSSAAMDFNEPMSNDTLARRDQDEMVSAAEPLTVEETDPFDLEQLEEQIREEESGQLDSMAKIISDLGSVGVVGSAILFALILLLVLRRRTAQQEKELEEALSGRLAGGGADVEDQHTDDKAQGDIAGNGSSNIDERLSEEFFEREQSADSAGENVFTTRLKLAEAYIEMGDESGALDMLDEVMADGSAEQQEVARRIMERLKGADG